MLWKRIVTLVILWVMSIASLWVLLQLKLISVAPEPGDLVSGSIFGLDIKLVGGGAMLATLMILFVFLLSKISATADALRTFIE